HPFYKPAVTFSINKSDVVTSVSHDLKKSTIEIFGIEREIEVVPNFIDISKYSQDYGDCQRSIMARDEERIITHISNFRKVKRIPDVIKIFHLIQQQLPAKLVMVGEGPEKENAEQLCDDLGIKDKVLFLGNSTEIDRILCFSDLFLLPSETESFGLAALEAMMNKVAVVSSNTGGIPEVNVDGVSGYMANVGDVEDMAAKALKILRDDQVLETFKENAKKVASKFDIVNILPLYEEIYDKAYKSRFKNTI